MIEDVVLGSRELQVGRFLYTCFEMGPTSNIMKWIPTSEPKVKKFSNGSSAEYVEAIAYNISIDEWEPKEIELPIVGIVNEQVNNSLTFPTMESAEFYLNICKNGTPSLQAFIDAFKKKKFNLL